MCDDRAARGSYAGRYAERPIALRFFAAKRFTHRG
jgi:hypothetical protein